MIDRTQGPNGAIYVVAMSKDASGNYFQRLHALDLGSGAELFGGPKNITASYPGIGDNSTGGAVVFDPAQYKERAALLLANGVVYTTWASHCDQRPYTGWVIGYDASTLNQAAVLNVTPNGNDGAIWMSGGGPAADTQGNIYVLDGNGTFDTTLDGNGFPSQANFGNGFLKLSAQSGTLTITDYFEMTDQQPQNDVDKDLGSGGTLLCPTRLTLPAKSGVWRSARVRLRSVPRRSANGGIQSRRPMPASNMRPRCSPDGVFHPSILQRQPSTASRAIDQGLPPKCALPPAPASQTSPTSLSWGNAECFRERHKDAILWAVENGFSATLHVYDASDLSKDLYNSNQAPFVQDQVGPGNKFITPTLRMAGCTWGRPTASLFLA